MKRLQYQYHENELIIKTQKKFHEDAITTLVRKLVEMLNLKGVYNLKEAMERQR